MFNTIKNFHKDQSGVAAVEFALVAPLMIALLLGMTEVSTAITSQRKVTSATSTVADLVARANSITDNDMTDVYSAAGAILEPFDTSSLQIRLTSVVIDLEGVQTVGWSSAQNMTPLVADDPYTLPDGIGFEGGSVIVGEVGYEHTNGIALFMPSLRTVTDEFYVQPRKTLQIERE